uniref:Uncharacterized protein n=1 Tax=Brassica oleracea var. oleracea TaxID=109376 RepID=A0A0D3DRE8_BRAOL
DLRDPGCNCLSQCRASPASEYLKSLHNRWFSETPSTLIAEFRSSNLSRWSIGCSWDNPWEVSIWMVVISQRLGLRSLIYRSPLLSRISIKDATILRGSVSIDVRDGMSIDVGSPLLSRISIKDATILRVSVSIDVRDGMSIDVG